MSVLAYEGRFLNNLPSKQNVTLVLTVCMQWEGEIGMGPHFWECSPLEIIFQNLAVGEVSEKKLVGYIPLWLD